MTEFQVGFAAAVRLIGTLQDDCADQQASFDSAIAELKSDGTDINASGRADGFLAGLEDFLEFWEASDSD